MATIGVAAPGIENTLYKGLGAKADSFNGLQGLLLGWKPLGKLNHDLGPLLWEHANAPPLDSTLNVLT